MRVILFAAAVAYAVTASAQFTNRSSVLDGSGTLSSGGSFTNLSAAGQPGGISESSSGGYVNQAGFLNTFSLKPALDTDDDGLADELDQDNDNDGLVDTTAPWYVLTNLTADAGSPSNLMFYRAFQDEFISTEGHREPQKFSNQRPSVAICG